MKKFTVYMHICPNNKKYIGITSNDVKKRWNSGYGYKTQKLFYRAIKKYRWNNIKHEILYKNLNQKEACNLEKELIKKYNLANSKFGYNCSIGGEETGLGSKRSIKWKKKMSEYHKAHPNSGQFKKGICPQTCFKKGRTPWNKGKESVKRKKVVCIEKNKIYNSITEAATDNNVSTGNISRVCNKKLKSLHKLHYKFL